LKGLFQIEDTWLFYRLVGDNYNLRYLSVESLLAHSVKF